MTSEPEIPQIHSSERLARFIFSRKKIYWEPPPPRAKRSAFMPEFFEGKLTMSVSRVSGLARDFIWLKGEEMAAARSEPTTMYGHADVDASVLQERLQVIPDAPDHANVEGWPPDKEDQMAIATELAAASELFVKA